MLSMLKLTKWRSLGRLKNEHDDLYKDQCLIEYFLIFTCLAKIPSYIRAHSKNSVVNVCRA